MNVPPLILLRESILPKTEKFRKGVPSVFKAKFFIPDLTAEEKSKLTLSVQDGSGNTITEGVQENGEILTFTPKNTKAKYTIIARYTNDKGEVIEKQIAGETEGNAVLGISHGAEVVRPGTAMSFSVSRMKYKFGADNSPYDLTSEESSEIKWNLNGIPQETGKSFTIAGSKLMTPEKYVVEAYSISANATGKNAKKEDDDWHFEVRENIVTEIKAGKKARTGVEVPFEISKTLLNGYGSAKDGPIVWKVTGPASGTGNGEKFNYKFVLPGNYIIDCLMGGRSSQNPLKIKIIQPKILIETSKWIDNDGGSGNIIKEAGYGQEVCAYVKYEGLQGEEVTLQIYDNDSNGVNLVHNIAASLPETGGVYWPFTLDNNIKLKIEAKGLTKDGKLHFKIAPKDATLKIVNGDKPLGEYLKVTNVPKIVDAYFCDASDTEKLYNSPIDKALYFKIYAINMVDKKVEVHFMTKSDMYFDVAWNPKQWKDWKDVKEKFAKETFFYKTEGTINKKGELIVKVDPSKLGKPKNYFKISAVVKTTEGDGKEAKEKAAYADHSDMAILYATAKLPDMVENKGAVKVGREQLSSGGNETTECCAIDEEYFCTNYEKEFPKVDKNGKAIPLSISVKNNLKRIFKSISEYYSNEKRCCNKHHIAYMLATAKHETGETFDPVEEANWLSWNVRKKYFEEMYDPILGKNEKRRSMALENENTAQGDGEKYFGRGYVQLTWKKNYRRMQEKFKVNFVDNRNNALDHELAMKIMIYGSEEGIFTGMKLSNYINDNKKDYYNARRVINGTDKATTIEGYAEKIEKCLKIKECNCGGKDNGNTGTPCSSCNKTHYNAAKPEHWISQEPSECWAASVKVLKNYGITGGARANCIIMADQDDKTLTPVDAQTGIDYIDSQLKIGNPVVVGLDDNLRKTTYNVHKATDHFFVIVGSGCENGKRYYNFFDVGSSKKEAGTSPDNKMFIKDNLLIKGKSNGGTHDYTVSEVRRNQ
ncbi:hypothetical protein ACMGDK_07350 [Chryseobacterium sp. DT-3]